MEDTTVSVRVDKGLHEQMKLHDDIKWSAVLRNSIVEKLEGIEQIDSEEARQASEEIDRIRKSEAFSSSVPAKDIIRKWRDRRR